MAEAFDITTQTSDETSLDRGRGEVSFQVTNRLGRSVRALIRAEPDGEQGARGDWLIVDKAEHAFAPGGATVVRVQVAVPAGTPAGRYPFRLVVAAEDQAGEQSRSAVVGLRYHSSRSALWAALIIATVVVAASVYGVYRWLAPPPCATERAVLDDETGVCACPAGMIESEIAGARVCLCAAGTAYDEDSGTCVPRTCEVQGALYAEVAGACSCPPGTHQAQVADGARCVCPLGQKYDPAGRACVPQPCPTPERAHYDERTGRCECPEGTALPAEAGAASCECPAGLLFNDATRRCATPPNLRVMWINVFPPLRPNRLFAFEVAIENAGGSPAGPFRVHLETSDAGVDFRDQIDVPGLAPGGKMPYKSPKLRVKIHQPLRIRARIEPLGFEESDMSDNVLEQSFRVWLRSKEEP
jgi:hypothetical protein